jgi:CMP-N,N'-diacetyllegionaminic acid synthase
MSICVIGARGGSKGLSNKNIKLLLGKPLLGWSIEQALSCPEISDVYVSTDSPDIANVAIEYGAKVTSLRPDYLANDTAGKWDVWAQFVNEMVDIELSDSDYIVDLDCTSPLRSVDDITNAINLYKNSLVDAVFSVCEARKNPYFNMVEYNDKYLEISKKLPSKIVRRQDAPKVYEHVASIYVLNVGYLRKGNNLLSGNTIGYDIGQNKSFDVDSQLDFELVEYFMKKRL